MPNELSAVCCDRTPDPQKQRQAIIALLKAGADIHATDKNGVTALHHAVRFRSPTAVATLLEHGAEVNQTCKRSGSTLLHRAVTSTGVHRHRRPTGRSSGTARHLIAGYGSFPRMDFIVPLAVKCMMCDHALRKRVVADFDSLGVGCLIKPSVNFKATLRPRVSNTGNHNFV